MSKPIRKILSFALAAAMALPLLPGFTAFAVDSGEPPLGASSVITAFATLAPEVSEQTVPLGTSVDALTLPDTLTATETDAGAEADIDIYGVTWQSSPEYEPDTPGTYTFTAVLPQGYSLAGGASLPVIAVTVTPGDPPPNYGGSVSGTLWLDMFEDIAGDVFMGDGVRQSQEQPLAGYAVSLYRAGDTASAAQTTTTGADGSYSFTGLEPGSYVAGVAAAVMNGAEYLLPLLNLDGSTVDNRFAAAYDAAADAYLHAYTAPIEIGAGTVITGMDAGMRTPPSMQTLALGDFVVTGDLNQAYDTLEDAVTAINNDTGTTYTITAHSSDAPSTALYINTGKNVTLTLDGAAKTITQSTNVRHFYVYGSLTLGSIVLDGNSLGGGVQVYSGGVLTMGSGAVIQNCFAGESGGGVYVGNGGTFNMNGGTIRGNTASHLTYGYGGGVYVGNGTFNMTGGTISGNTARYGGGVCVRIGTFNMSGGTISGNTAHDGGGVMADDGSIFTMSGGAISGNTADYGGGVYVAIGTFTMSGGAISGNMADDGGGVFVSSNASMNATGSVSITDNSASDNGGGIYTEDTNYANLTTTGSGSITFSGNKAGAAYEPPAPASLPAAISVLNLSGSSIAGKHPLNNYDINYTGGGSGTPVTLHTVTYHSNNAAQSEVYDYCPDTDISITVIANPFLYPGYTFAGWNTQANGGGTAYQPGDTLPLSGNVTLYAQWTTPDASINPASATFDKFAPANVSTTLTRGIHSLTKITCGGTDLTEGSQYTENSGIYTFSQAWLATLANSGHTITFEMSGGTNPTFALTVSDSTPPALTYTLTVANGTDITNAGPYAQGAVVAIKANDPPLGKEFDKWTGGNGGSFANANSATTTFTMPANAAIVTATYRDKNTGGSSSGGGGGDYVYVPSTVSGNITVNKISVPYSGNGGLLTTSITAANLRSMVDNAFKNESGKKIVKISYNGVSGSASLTKLTLTFDASKLKVDEDVTFIIETPFGVFIFTTEQMLKWFGGNTFGTYTLTLEKSSLRVDVKKDGKSAAWNSLTPMARIGVPYTLKSGESAANIVVTDKNGRVLPTSAYEKGMVYADIYALGTYKAESKTPAAFTDTADHVAKADIDYVTLRGLISGASGTTFAPGTAITRAEYLMALGKLAGSDVSGYKQSSFSDVSISSVYMPYIEWAAKNNIVNPDGVGGGRFAPDSPITREQMAVMMVNYAKALGYELPALNSAAAYADSASINAWAKDAVTAMQKAGIMSGKDGNRFDPQANVTRAEAATILRSFVENVISSRDAKGWSNANTDLNKRVYYNQNGNALTGWQTIGGDRYYFGSDGVMRTGWLDVDGKRYCFYANGKLIARKWAEIGGKWYYFYEDGTLAVNTKIDGYEVGADGARK